MILLIYGGGSLGREIYDLVCRNSPPRLRWEKIYFIDDFADEGTHYLGESIHFDSLGKKFKNRFDELEFVVAIGEPSDRKILYDKMKNAGIKPATLIDKTTVISPTVKIGAGSVIFEMSSLHSNSVVGENVLMYSFSAVTHDVKIGNHSVITSGAKIGGGVELGEKVFVGLGANLRDKIKIGDDAIIGMGAVVLKNVTGGSTVVGNPGKIISGDKEHKVFK